MDFETRLKQATKQARERFKKHDDLDNILFVAELLDLESEQCKNKEISLKLSKIVLELSKILTDL